MTMETKSNIYRIRFTNTQIETLHKLESYNINVPDFIRIAICEKIKRDYKTIKEPISKVKVPF